MQKEKLKTLGKLISKTASVIFLGAIAFANAAELSVEIPVYGTYGFINLPGAMNPPLTHASSGWGYNAGAGLSLRVTDMIGLRLGYTHFTLPLKTQFEQGSNKGVENAVLTYNGFYAYAQRFWNAFYLQGGFDFGMNPVFKGSQVISLNGQESNEYLDQRKSILTEKFNNLFHIFAGMGVEFPVWNAIHGALEYNAAFLSNAIFDSGAMAASPTMVNGQFTGDMQKESVDITFLATSKFGIRLIYLVH